MLKIPGLAGELKCTLKSLIHKPEQKFSLSKEEYGLIFSHSNHQRILQTYPELYKKNEFTEVNNEKKQRGLGSIYKCFMEEREVALKTWQTRSKKGEEDIPEKCLYNEISIYR